MPARSGQLVACAGVLADPAVLILDEAVLLDILGAAVQKALSTILAGRTIIIAHRLDRGERRRVLVMEHGRSSRTAPRRFVAAGGGRFSDLHTA
jgi:ABC-type multidrug transport system fused ATPase/permease subunit